MKTTIVIAAYNAEDTLQDVLKELHKHGYNDVIVVDDGSKDKTSDVAFDNGAVVLRHIINRGQGAALKTGIDHALEEGADIIVTFDADGQHRAEDIRLLVQPVAKKEVDVALGSRFLGKRSNIPFVRKILLKGSILVLWIFYGVKMTDAHNGFRALSRKAAQQIEITSDRMEHASQIVEEIHRKRIKYKEVPVIIRYSDYTVQHGHGSLFQGFKVLGKMILRRLTR